MRYLYPRSVKVHNPYRLRNQSFFTLPNLVFFTLKSSKKTSNEQKLISFLLIKELIELHPLRFKPKRVCWVNSRARWVLQDFNFSRGVIKQLFTTLKIPGFKPRAWL